jgi:hypothetical protein
VESASAGKIDAAKKAARRRPGCGLLTFPAMAVAEG